jgi:hypothetical protein
MYVMLVLIVGELTHLREQKLTERFFPQPTVVEAKFTVVEIVIQTTETDGAKYFVPYASLGPVRGN